MQRVLAGQACNSGPTAAVYLFGGCYVGLALPPDPELLADLTAPRFEVRASGIVVEAKEKLKERISRSPDKGDAVCLAHLQAPLWEPPSSSPSFASVSQPITFGPRVATRSAGQPQRRLYGGDR